MTHNDIVSLIKDFTFFFYKGKRYCKATLDKECVSEIFTDNIIKEFGLHSYEYVYAIHTVPCYIDDVLCVNEEYILTSYYYFTDTKEDNIAGFVNMSFEDKENSQWFDVGDDLLYINKHYVAEEELDMYYVNCETYYRHIRSHGSEYVQYHSGMDWKCLINKCKIDAENNTADVQLKYLFQEEEKLIDIHIDKNKETAEINGMTETLAAIEEKYLLEFVMYYLSFYQI